MSSSRTARGWRAVLALVTVAGLSCAVAGPADAASDPTLTDQYTAVGTSHIGSINADLPISSTKLVETLDLNNLKIVGGTLPIAPQTVSFKALGLVPLRSTVSLIQASPITGSITATDNGNVLSTSVKYTIKLSNVQASVLGRWVPLNVGDSCQTSSPVTIAAASPAGQYFDIFNGGVVTGSYTIGNFTGCKALNLPLIGSLAINALVPGKNNTVRITLSDGQFVSGT